jgi:translation initiation factor 3 subunit B
MAPSFDHLRDADVDEDDYDEDEIDISDLQEKFQVQLEQGYDSFVVIDGLPEVTEDQKPRLVKFLLKKLNQVGKTHEGNVYMPMGEDGKSLGCAFRLDTRHSSIITKTLSNTFVGSPS